MERPELRRPFELELTLQLPVLEPAVLDSEPEIAGERDGGAAPGPSLRRFEPALLEDVRVLLEHLSAVQDERELGDAVVVQFAFDRLDRVENRARKARAQRVGADSEQESGRIVRGLPNRRAQLLHPPRGKVSEDRVDVGLGKRDPELPCDQ